MAHRPRPTFASRHPSHVTIKVRRDVPSLRTVKLVRELERTFAAGCERPGFRVVEYSLQGNHAHFIVEARDRQALASGMKSLAARVARAVNRVFGRSGAVLAERYHSRALKTPREVRNALRYVLLNARHHARRPGKAIDVDPASSARWFQGWRKAVHTPGGPRPVGRARTWLLRIGWRRHGLLDPSDVPSPRAP